MPLVDPSGQQASQPGHGQHAMGEHIGRPALREVQVDGWVVVIGPAGIECQGRPVDRRQHQGGSSSPTCSWANAGALHGAGSSSAPAMLMVDRMVATTLAAALVGDAGFQHQEPRGTALLLVVLGHLGIEMGVPPTCASRS